MRGEGAPDAVMIEARNPPRAMLASDDPALAIKRMAVLKPAGRLEHTHRSVVLDVPKDAIVGDVGPEHVARRRNIDRPLRPAASAPNTLELCVANDQIVETLVTDFVVAHCYRSLGPYDWRAR